MLRLTISALLLTALFSLALGALHLQPRIDLAQVGFESCAAPCWHGMEPGFTSYDDASARFAAIGWKADDSFCIILSSGCTDFRWWNPDQLGEWAGVHFHVTQIDGIVIETPGLTLGQLLQKFGTPSTAYQYGDSNGRVIFYSALWSGIGAAVVMRCPITYAALLQKPIEAIVLSQFNNPSRETALPSFRSV